MDDSMDHMLLDLLRTVDSKGNLMPSFLDTKVCDEAVSRGWVEMYPEPTFGSWMRLTPAGIDEKRRRGV
jgi:hypothetical protein